MFIQRTASCLLWLALVACTHSAAPATRPGTKHPPAPDPGVLTPLSPPEADGSSGAGSSVRRGIGHAVDPKASAAEYVGKVAAQFQPGWKQFLSDCQLRLPPSHALNQMALATTAEIVVDRTGHVVRLGIAVPSGNADFDRAVREVVTDPSPLAVPPAELLSDDDRVHLRWLFARDLRQAGPATAEVLWVELPLAGVVDRLIETDDLARAARRIAVASGDTDRDAATTRVMLAALRQALRGLDGSVRRSAVEATGQARAIELIAEVRGLLTATSDADLRVAAITAAADLNDAEAVPAILRQLPDDLAKSPSLALAAARALVRLGRVNDAAVIIRRALVSDAPNPVALEAFAVAPSYGLERKFDLWFARGTPRTRAALCGAMAGLPPAQGARRVRRGLVDRDATVRASCTATAAHIAASSPSLLGSLVSAVRPLVHDRDRKVRARAIEAIAVLDPSHAVDATNDPAPEVRAAYARGLTAANPDLRVLASDREPQVRAAAWATLTSKQPAPSDLAQLAHKAVGDTSPPVRLAALGALDDLDTLAHIALNDDAPELRTAALVQLARKRGRAHIADLLLERLASSAPGTADSVRVALAWLLAQ